MLGCSPFIETVYNTYIVPHLEGQIGVLILLHHISPPLTLGVFMPLDHQIVSVKCAKPLIIQEPFIIIDYIPLKVWLEAPYIDSGAVYFSRQIL